MIIKKLKVAQIVSVSFTNYVWAVVDCMKFQKPRDPSGESQLYWHIGSFQKNKLQVTSFIIYSPRVLKVFFLFSYFKFSTGLPQTKILQVFFLPDDVAELSNFFLLIFCNFPLHSFHLNFHSTCNCREIIHLKREENSFNWKSFPSPSLLRFLWMCQLKLPFNLFFYLFALESICA